MTAKPIRHLGQILVALGDLQHESLGLVGGGDHFKSTHQQESPRDDEAGSLVSVRERMILRDATKKEGGAVEEVYLGRCWRSTLGEVECGGRTTEIYDSSIATEPLDDPIMDVLNVLQGGKPDSGFVRQGVVQWPAR